MKRIRNNGWFIHAPCVISDIREDKDGVTLIADGWGNKPYYMLISGLERKPIEVHVRKLAEKSRKSLPLKSAERKFYREHKYLIISLEGKSEIQIR